jgi:pSer/pThr/pTyr-binding forkhead associated (FHA) protein
MENTARITVRDTQGREYRSDSGRMEFGRGADCKVCIPGTDKSVSTSHCILYREEGKLYLMDLGSTNGTFLKEEERLQPNVPYRAHKGMEFFLGSRAHTFVIAE